MVYRMSGDIVYSFQYNQGNETRRKGVGEIAVGRENCERKERRVRGTGDAKGKEHVGAVPGIWDFQTNRI
jgi:hypothetical protein